jgi:macrolide-specific efflux system membrane fusion protein
MAMHVNLSKRTWVMMLVLVAGAALAAGVYFWRGAAESKPSYREVTVARGDLEVNVIATGVIQPRNRLEIKPPIAGRVEEVLVAEGQTVRRSQILAWMSSSERAALIDAARAKGSEESKRWEELYRPAPILAPIDGAIISRNVEPGQSFTSNDAVFVMSDRLIVVAQVDETDIAQVKLRQPAHIVLDAYPDHSFDGRVDQIAFDAKTVNNVTTYAVEVIPEKVPGFMRSGMTANVSFRVASRKDVLWISNDALRVRDGKASVLPAGANGPGEERGVTVGLTDGKRSEIVEGLAEGDKVLAVQIKTTTGKGSDKPSSPFMPGRTPRR